MKREDELASLLSAGGEDEEDNDDDELEEYDDDDEEQQQQQQQQQRQGDVEQGRDLLYYSTVDRILAENRVYLKYFWKILLIVSIFYLMPSLQFVVYQSNGDSVHCYYNEKCRRDLGSLKAFNNIISNILYVVFGASFLVIVYLTRPKEDERRGLHTDMSLNYALGLCLCIEGVFSALYHVCPSRQNFQFDSTYMIIGIALLMVSLYQKRHGMRTIGAARFYGWMAVLNMVNSVTLYTTHIPAAMWVIVFFVLFYALVVGSFHLYFHRHWIWDKSAIHRVSENVRSCHIRDKPRFVVLLVVNIVTLSVAIAGALSATQFSDYVLSVFLVNLLVYLTYYIVMKKVNHEGVHWRMWIFLLMIIGTTSAALYFFNQSVTNKLLPVEESNALNQPCILFDYFDAHDVWHFLSATASFLLLIMIYTIDNGLQDTPRTDIRVF